MTLDTYRRKRRFDRTPEPRGSAIRRPRAGRATATSRTLRGATPPRPATALRRAARDRRRPSLMGRAARSDRSTRAHAAGHPRRGPPARVLRFRGRHPRRAIRRRRRDRLGLGSLDGGPSIADAAAALEAGELKFRLEGEKLHGGFVLVRTGRLGRDGKDKWLLIHRRDEPRLPAGTPRTIPRQRQDRAHQRRGRGRRRPKRRGVASSSARAARPIPMPDFIDPMLATLVAAPFDDPDWLFEIKWDGFRVEAVVDGGRSGLWTRGRQDAARYFGPFLDPPTWIDARDGDRRRRGRRARRRTASPTSRCSRIGSRRRSRRPGDAFVYEVFDLL